jgi:ribonuclease T2
LLAIATVSPAKDKKNKNQSASSPGFSYYMLVLSYAPDFCAQPQGQKDPRECGPGRHVGFVVHGLWPQNDDGSWPQSCAPAQPVSNEIVREMLPIMPARGLIQHEWARHGTCSGLAVQDYFGRVQQLYKQVKVPPQFQQPKQGFDISPRTLEQNFTQENNAPQGAFQVSCKNGDLVELDVCFTKDFQYRACGKSSARCHVPQVKVLPVP